LVQHQEEQEIPLLLVLLKVNLEEQDHQELVGEVQQQQEQVV
jgi:hypothetical protein